jgi:1-deoxy-D-xylulose-5-phosphate reductoisomerase
MKKVVILGSTGTIGRATIAVLRKLKGFRIVGLAAYRNRLVLDEQISIFDPPLAGLIDPAPDAWGKPDRKKTRFLYGEAGLHELVEKSRADIMVCALSSTIGVTAVIKGIKSGMRICLATKEILVSFGEIIMDLVRRHRVELIPVDSEHSAIFQCLRGESPDSVRNIFLTASGGPFLNRDIHRARKSDVLNHPVWKMGQKITVDSATMMNKGLEIIEAHHLFGLPPEKIKVVIHPEAICHSMVQFVDGSIKAQFSYPDMKLPIQYALTLPDRQPGLVRHIDMGHFQKLSFLEPDFRKFPALGLSYRALKTGKSMPAVLNAANAEAVKLFLEDRIKFSEITGVIEKTLKAHYPVKGDINHYIAQEKWAHKFVRSIIN